jgi:hypothetical protein
MQAMHMDEILEIFCKKSTVREMVICKHIGSCFESKSTLRRAVLGRKPHHHFFIGGNLRSASV